MENEEILNSAEGFVYPEYIGGQSLTVKKLWEDWKKIGEKIDNHPKRFYTVIHPKTDEVKIFDIKNSKGLLGHQVKQFGASKEDFDAIMKIKDEIYQLQKKKAVYYRNWSKEAYSGKVGDRTVLNIKYAEILEMFGSYQTTNEVYKAIHEWGFVINQERLKQFQIDNKDKIKALKLEYLSKKNDFKFATDTGRLEVLSKLANENMDKYDKTKHLSYSREVRALLEQIRKEVKGEEIRLTFDGRIDINATITANKTMNEVFSKLPINLMVIGLTAAKAGINPGVMMNRLANSYYSKWNGFAKLEDKESIDLPGKYIKNYDWNAIKKMHEESTEDQVEDVEHEEIFDNNVDKIEFVQKKSSLLDMLNDYKKQLKQ